MQVIGEATNCSAAGIGSDEAAAIFAEWNRGELESYLIEITADLLAQKDFDHRRTLVDVIMTGPA